MLDSGYFRHPGTGTGGDQYGFRRDLPVPEANGVIIDEFAMLHVQGDPGIVE